ncbi:MAG: hypothetical protein WDZ77_02545 [Candidatus Pacearchaeota archaeon]
MCLVDDGKIDGAYEVSREVNIRGKENYDSINEVRGVYENGYR